MFGRKETEKRSLEDMFTPRDDVCESIEGEVISEDLKEKTEEQCEVDTEKSSRVPIKPLDCFGMEEEKTDKWLGKCVKFWFCLMSFFWFLFGAVTFAPVIFISNKVNVIFKDKKKSFLASVIIYAVCVALLFIFL